MSDKVSNEELAELARLHKAATPGQWKTKQFDELGEHYLFTSDPRILELARIHSAENAASIVANHNAIGRLITELQARRVFDKETA